MYKDKEIAYEIKDLFRNKLDKIDAVCFVAISAMVRLTPTQEFVMASMTEIFGGNVAECVTVLATFCDGGKVAVKEALGASPSFQQVKAKIPENRKLVYEFNNSAIFVDPAVDKSNLL